VLLAMDQQSLCHRPAMANAVREQTFTCGRRFFLHANALLPYSEVGLEVCTMNENTKVLVGVVVGAVLVLVLLAVVSGGGRMGMGMMMGGGMMGGGMVGMLVMLLFWVLVLALLVLLVVWVVNQRQRR